MIKDVLYIIDLDRTLIDVEKVMEVTGAVCKEMGIDFKKIYKDQQDLSKRGTAYSPFGYISKRARVDINQFRARFIERSKNGRILFSDSQDFIDSLKRNSFDFLILTHGVDDSWQELKIKAAGLSDIPYVIVKDRYKSRFISNWFSNGHIHPGIDRLSIYKRCIFVDDRKEAFIDMPDNCQGYLLDRTEKLSEQAVDQVTGIKVIKTLSEIS